MFKFIKRNFSSPNKYLLLSIFSLFGIFYILLEDIFKDRELSFDYRFIIYILIAILLLTFSIHKFFNKTSKEMTSAQIIISLIFSSILAYGIQTYIKGSSINLFSTKKFDNPLTFLYREIAKEYNLDLSFTEVVQEGRGSLNYKVNTIFEQSPKSIDILIFGDSSMLWGVVPEVIEQLTHKKVALYVYESSLLTAKKAKLFNKISTYYLKDNGAVILSFDNWTQDQDPNSVLQSKKEYKEIMSWNDKKFDTFAKNYIKNKVIDTNTNIDTDKSVFSFKQYQKEYKYLSESLKYNYHVELKSANIYLKYLEQYINLPWHEIKEKNENLESTSFLMWNHNTVTLYDKTFHYKSMYSGTMPTTILKNENNKINALAASKIYGKNKFYMVPLFHVDYLYSESRNIYQSYYKKKNFKIIDLGKYHPKNTGYPMQIGSHMGNEGGLMKSIIIAKALNEKLD